MILVTGAAGMTGSHLLDVYAPGDLYQTDLTPSPGIEYLDIRDFNQVIETMARVRPHLVLHLGAETDVDRCEGEVDHAFRSNMIGTLNLTLACRRFDADILYVSTAGLFDGKKKEPYTEFDPPGPVNVYARAKLEGEKIVQSLYPRHYIVRAGWMFGGRARDKKFVGKIAARCLEGGPETQIKAVNDKKGSPTYARDLLFNAKILSESGFYGLYHIVNKGSCTRYDVAVEIARCLNSSVSITPITSDAFVLPAERPDSEAARSYKLDLLNLNHMQPWQDALRDYLLSWLTPAAPLGANSGHGAHHDDFMKSASGD